MAAQATAGLKRFYLVLGVVAAIGAAALAFMMRRKPVSIPADVTVTAGDTAGFHGYVTGDPNAPLEIVEYADYQCPGCASFETVQFPTIEERLIRTGRVRWRYRDFPLGMHRHARTAAHAAACADEQGKYREMHRFIYESQNDWSFINDAAGHFRSLAKPAGLDVARYDDCMSSARFAGRIQASYDEAVKVGATGTPALLIGGRIYGGLPYDALKRIVDSLVPAAPAPAAPAR
jgi:protein-disulfide isomerase